MSNGVDPEGFFNPHQPSQGGGREIPTPLPVNHILGSLTYAHTKSSIQTDQSAYPGYIEHAENLARETMAGGTTSYATPPKKGGAHGLDVGGSEWYGVGGATDVRTGKQQPGWKTPAESDQKPSALAHILNTEANNFERAHKGRQAVYAGGWARDSHGAGQPGEGAKTTAVYDQTSVYSDPKRAETSAKQRGEDAYFDAKNIQEVFVK